MAFAAAVVKFDRLKIIFDVSNSAVYRADAIHPLCVILAFHSARNRLRGGGVARPKRNRQTTVAINCQTRVRDFISLFLFSVPFPARSQVGARTGPCCRGWRQRRSN